MTSDTERLTDELFGILGIDESFSSGWPDRLIRRLDGSLALVEMKSGNEPLNPRQKAIASRLRELGIGYYVVRIFKLSGPNEVASDASDVIRRAPKAMSSASDHTRAGKIRALLLRRDGKSLTEIAHSVVPPVTRQRVHQIKMAMEASGELSLVRPPTPPTPPLSQKSAVVSDAEGVIE